MDRREKMRDYVRELMREAHEKGTPVIRSMWYQFPDDKECTGLKEQYMFGGRYLVAPVLRPGVDEIKVYLPEGKWRSVEYGDTYEGGRRIDAKAPIDVIPVFEKL